MKIKKLIQYFQGQTPLMRAARHGFVEAVQTLVNVNAKTNIRDLDGNGLHIK